MTKFESDTAAPDEVVRKVRTAADLAYFELVVVQSVPLLVVAAVEPESAWVADSAQYGRVTWWWVPSFVVAVAPLVHRETAQVAVQHWMDPGYSRWRILHPWWTRIQYTF